MESHAIETRHLKIFVTVYKERSFTKAAELLFTSQPTISEHMQNLESRLKCKLFDRMGRTILPTSEAELLYPKALDILEDIQKLEDQLTASREKVAGELVIGASTIPGVYLLPAIAASFKQEFPEISFEIRIDDSKSVLDGLTNNQLYLGVVGAKLPSSRLQFHHFASDELILAAAPISGVAAKISVEELCQLPFIVRENGSGTRKSTEILLDQQDHSLEQLNICATLGSTAAVKEAIKANLGVSIISRYGVQEDLDSGKVCEIQVQGLSLMRDFYIVTSKKRTLPNHYATFLEKLKSFASL